MEAKLLRVGSWIVTRSANTAMTNMRTTTKPPAAPRGFCRQNCHSTARRDRVGGSWSATGSDRTAMREVPSACVADARVEPRIGDVDDEVGEGEDGHHEHDQRLGHVVVVVGHRLDEQLAEPVEVEDLIGYDQTAHQERELDADD